MKDKVAFVTGAARGMGEAAVRSFAQAGAAVIIADVDMDAANTLANELTSSGARATAVHCDVTKSEDVKAAVEKAVSLYGRLDFAFKGAPIGRIGQPQEIADAVLWLCSPQSSFVIGQALTVDGGITIL